MCWVTVLYVRFTLNVFCQNVFKLISNQNSNLSCKKVFAPFSVGLQVMVRCILLASIICELLNVIIAQSHLQLYINYPDHKTASFRIDL